MGLRPPRAVWGGDSCRYAPGQGGRPGGHDCRRRPWCRPFQVDGVIQPLHLAEHPVPATIGDASLAFDVDMDQLPQGPGVGSAPACRWGGPAPTAEGPGGGPAPPTPSSGPRPAPSRSRVAQPCSRPEGQDGLPRPSGSRLGLVWGRELRSARPAKPSARQRRTHLSAVATQTPRALAARTTGQPSSTTRSTSSCRPATVSFAWMHPESLVAEFLDSPQPGGSHQLHNLSENHS